MVETPPDNDAIQRPMRAVIDYTNYRGERGWRIIIPQRMHFKAVPPYHVEPQWILLAWDVHKVAYRSFAVTSIHKWMTVAEYEARAHRAAGGQ